MTRVIILLLSLAFLPYFSSALPKLCSISPSFMASSFSDTALNLLLSCAVAIEDGHLKSADAFLQNILILADKNPYPYQSEVVKYFADALVRRAYGLHPASSSLAFPVDPAPYYHYNSYHINGVIEKVIGDALMGNRRLHLIDFSIPYFLTEGSVLRTLPTFSGDPLPVRVSYILPPFLKKHVKFSRQMEFLTKDAKEVNVKLEDELKVVYGNSLAEVNECEMDFKRRRDDEMVVVYYKFKLDDKFGRDAKAMERELVRLKEINPTILIMLDFYSNHTHSNFLTCFKDSFQYSLKTIDCWVAQWDNYLHWEIKFQEEAISSIPTSSNTAMPLKIAENAHIEQIIFNDDSQIAETKRNKQRKSWSKVWVDFDKFEEHGKQVAKCKHRLKVFTGSSKSGTAHLNNHSKVCPGKKKQNQESQLILPVDTNERSSTFDQERSHLDLVKMVIRHQYPLDLAGQEAFKNFVKSLQPMYEFQSRDKLLSDIHRIYNEEREKL
ncbi:hypothetical protein ES332_D02G016100v1 [Gossypium tomentosum]|uniref:Uncharacterized protein n=1 Tax=Gossypium tomentosum TaxID=34277 RepID=A0A5D2LS74_GOSTO|nr:hypothetical protein ES332_D02G016100v1 [Gossypium tomentosum]